MEAEKVNLQLVPATLIYPLMTGAIPGPADGTIWEARVRWHQLYMVRAITHREESHSVPSSSRLPVSGVSSRDEGLLEKNKSAPDITHECAGIGKRTSTKRSTKEPKYEHASGVFGESCSNGEGT